MATPWQSRLDWGAVLVPAVALFAYASTTAPSITWAAGGTDSGDVATAVAVLGIAHPPGYPLFVLTGHAATRALAWVEPARALNLYCAALAAAGAWLLYRAARCLSGSQVPALGAALTAALGPLWWAQANHATPHALNALFAAAIVWLAARWLPAPPTSAGLLAGGALVGLAASHHLTLLAPAAALLLVERRLLSPAGLIGAALGHLPWLALPLIAAADPPHAWGDPTTLPGFLDLVLARDYRAYLEPYPARLAYGVRTVVVGAGLVAFLAAAVGLAVIADANRRYAVFCAAAALPLLAFFALYPARDVEAYLLPALAALTPAAAVGLRAAGRWAPPAVALAIAAAIAAAWPAVNLADDRQAIAFARDTLAAAPAGAALLTDDDRATFPLWYAHLALGLRPDVAVVDRSLAAFAWYRARLARHYPDLSVDADGTVHGRPVSFIAPPG